jgi:hypothetical protein
MYFEIFTLRYLYITISAETGKSLAESELRRAEDKRLAVNTKFARTHAQTTSYFSVGVGWEVFRGGA